MIKREEYLNKIRGFYDADLIKVITGIRRCGKSVLLRQIIDEIKEKGIDEKHIMYINFEDINMVFIKNAFDLNDYVQKYIVDDKKYYLFFDEIQNVIEWERAINSFKATKNVSIFITGSNSNLLSSELSTLLSGRYVAFKLMPFSFKEVCKFKNITDRNDIYSLFEDYMKYGGMPQRFSFDNENDIKVFLTDIYNSIIMKDIVTRYNIKDTELLTKLIEYLCSTYGQQISIKNITNYLNSENRKCSLETIYAYLGYITNSFIINRAKRYDIKGKRLLSTNDKCYLTDIGIANVVNNGKLDLGSLLENIVYNELLKRGYDIKVGKTENGEIDFIVTKFNEKCYYQVTYYLYDDKIIEREFGAFKKIDDNYPKYVISMDKFDFSRDGIIHKNIIDFLLEDN